MRHENKDVLIKAYVPDSLAIAFEATLDELHVGKSAALRQMIAGFVSYHAHKRAMREAGLSGERDD